MEFKFHASLIIKAFHLKPPRIRYSVSPEKAVSYKVNIYINPSHIWDRIDSYSGVEGERLDGR